MFRVPHEVLKNYVSNAEVKVPKSETVQEVPNLMSETLQEVPNLENVLMIPYDEDGESMYIVSEYVENAQPQPENVIQGNSHAVQNGGEENYQFLNPDFSEVFN